MAKELKKTIIPCKHTPVKWSRLEEIGIRTQGIPFETKEELIRLILPRLEEEFGFVSTPTQVNNDTAQRHEVRLPTKSNWWQIREIEQHLEDASKLDEFSNQAFIIGWMFRVESSLKEMFGETSGYYRLFPRITLRELSDARLPYDYPNTRFKEAKNTSERYLKKLEQKIIIGEDKQKDAFKVIPLMTLYIANSVPQAMKIISSVSITRR